MKAKKSKYLKKMKQYISKVLKSDKDLNLKSRIKDEAKLKQMQGDTKVY
jgi:hypothetical protein